MRNILFGQPCAKGTGLFAGQHFACTVLQFGRCELLRLPSNGILMAVCIMEENGKMEMAMQAGLIARDSNL